MPALGPAKILAFPKKEGDPPRWRAVIAYRRDGDLVELQSRGFEELGELEDVVEHGHHWGAIIDIKVVLERNDNPQLTVEQSEKL